MPSALTALVRSPALRAVFASLLVIFAVGGIPGAAMRPMVFDLVAQPPPVPSAVKERDGTVQVTVHDGSPGDGRAGGTPLAGAHVRAVAIVDGRAYLADAHDTDAGGRARLSKLPPGDVWVLADAPGRARGSTHLVVDGTPREVTIDLGAEHVIDVVVKDERALAVAGAEIEAVASVDPLPIGARTGSDGVAHVTRLGLGPWRLTVRAPGFDETSARASRDGETVSVVLRKLGSIDVHVVDDGERPAFDARVEVAGAMLWPPRAAETDGHGDVRIGGLAAGTYALRATWGDRVSPIELGVVLDRGEEKSLTLRLGPGHFVGVRVTDGDGEDAAPVASARVALAEGGLSPFPLEATTDAKGRARLGPIAPGIASLSARAEGFVPRGGVPVTDPPQPETRIALVRAGVLTGRVVDARGYPIDGATIEIVGTDTSGAPIVDDPRRASFQVAHFDAMLAGPAPLVPAGELGVMPGPVPPIPAAGASLPTGGAVPMAATLRDAPPAEPWVTRDDGTFRAAPASPGRIRAIVHHPQYVEAQSDLVTLAPGGEAHVEVVMHAGGTLEGRVVDAQDRPVEGARVSVAATRGTMERTTRTGSDGSFAFAALPDQVSVAATALDEDEQPDVRLQIAIPEGGRKEVTIRLPAARDPLAITVVDDRDFPVATAQVSASSLSADVPLRTTAFTDTNGETTLRHARGLPLRIEVSAPGHAPKVVTTDGSGDALRIALSPSESATGEVVTSRGRDAIAGADVTLYTDLGVRRARTDAQGTFTIAQLAPGPAKLRVRAAGFAPASAALTIPDSGGRRPFAIPRVELAEEGVVEGDVVDARGDPVAGARVARGHVPTWLVVGAAPDGVAVTDASGHFILRALLEGTVALEAYAPDVGRGRAEGIKVVSGRTTDRVRITLASGGGPTSEPSSSGGVAVTLGETDAPVEVVIASVAEGSEAERAGLAPGDVVLAVDGAPVHTMEEARAKMSGPIADDVVVQVRRGEHTLALRVTREAVRR